MECLAAFYPFLKQFHQDGVRKAHYDMRNTVGAKPQAIPISRTCIPELHSTSVGLTELYDTQGSECPMLQEWNLIQGQRTGP